MKPAHFARLVFVAVLLTSCGTRTESSVKPTLDATQATAVKLPAKPVQNVVVTENDITDRRYEAIGDIEVTVKKWTIFDADPTREMVADALRKKAAEMGADAVVLARYGTVGVGFFSWGQMEGQGRAVVFK